MRVTVVVRLVVMALAGVITVGWLATASLSASRTQAGAAREMATASEAMGAQWNADMMHDGLRADVLGAIAATSAADRQAFAVDEVADHAATMLERLDAAADGAPEELREDYAAVRPKVADYVASAAELVRLAASDRAAARARLPQFLAAFGVLEEDLGSIDDRFQAALRRIEQQSETTSSRSARSIVLVAVIGTLLLGGLSVVILRGVVGPIRRLRRSLATVAAGDFRVACDTGRGDEFGELERSVDAVVASVRNAFGEVDRFADQLTDSAAALRSTSHELDDDARRTNELAASSVALAESLTSGAEAVRRGMGMVSGQTHGIAASAGNASAVGRRAVEGAASAATAITRLGESSAEISGVVSMIRSISDQTRLLALNATIEAARAGEAGRGFAVVANEVKDLAQEVGQATGDISARIAAIQEEVQGAVSGIRSVTEVISEMNAHQQDIAGAVEQQSSTSTEVTGLIDDASAGAGQIAEQVGVISSAAGSTAAGAGVALESSRRLTEVAESMRATLRRYAF